jgi:hypothetical protein
VPAAGSADLARQAAAVVRSGAASLCALAIVATVVPLAVAQIPDAIAWSLPPRMVAGGPAVVTSVLRASGSALPAMAVAGSLAAGHCTLTAAALAGTVALALACTGRRRPGAGGEAGPDAGSGAGPGAGPGHVAGGAPVPGAGATPDHG